MGAAAGRADHAGEAWSDRVLRLSLALQFNPPIGLTPIAASDEEFRELGWSHRASPRRGLLTPSL